MIEEPISPLNKLHLEYLKKLMALDTGGEGRVSTPPLFEEPDFDIETGKTVAMRVAQRYLRIHRIFELLQFLTAHLLSARPGINLQWQN